MDKVHPFSTPMINRTLDSRNDLFRLKDDGEEILRAEVLYLSAIGALLYLSTRHLSLVVNLLARFSFAPTQRQLSGIKTIFRYLKGTIDLGLFYLYREKS